MGSEVAIRCTPLAKSGLRDEISRGSLVYPDRGTPDPTGCSGQNETVMASPRKRLIHFDRWIQARPLAQCAQLCAKNVRRDARVLGSFHNILQRCLVSKETRSQATSHKLTSLFFLGGSRPQALLSVLV